MMIEIYVIINMYSIWIYFSVIVVLFVSFDIGLFVEYFSELLFMCSYMFYIYCIVL